MSLELTVETELALLKGNKSALMTRYANEQQVIINKYGENRSDVPADPHNSDVKEFNRIQLKLNLLGKM
jgi:hypothetical protein